MNAVLPRGGQVSPDQPTCLAASGAQPSNDGAHEVVSESIGWRSNTCGDRNQQNVLSGACS